MNRKAIISILNFNGTEDTIECIKSIYRYENCKDYLIVIWDNASRKEMFELLENFIINNYNNSKVVMEDEYCINTIDESTNIVLVKSEENYGFAIANNKVLQPFVGKFEYYILLNNDTEFYQPTTTMCLDYLDKNKHIGVLTTSIYYYYDKSKIWNAGGKFIFGWRKYYTEEFVKHKINEGTDLLDVDYITGCYMIIRDSIVQKYGLLTEKYFFGEEDYNYCMKMKKNNVKLSVKLDLGIWHKVGATTSRDANKDKKMKYAFVHYLNRVIDMKDFWGKLKWNIWCMLSTLIFLRRALQLTDLNFRRSFNFVRQILKNKNRSCVDKKFFFEIMNGKVDI